MTHRWRQRRKLTAAAAATGVLVALGAAGSPAQAAQSAQAARGHSAARSEVVSGDARFEVLSPTLIRTEYAGDAKFVDTATFNAIGRDTFGRTPFTSSIRHGELTIRTSAMTLTYKVGSGKFTADNLKVTEKAGKQSVTAAPWPNAPVCAVGTRCEAEAQALNGVGVATDHSGYTGSGFAAGFQSTGNSLSFSVTVPKAGTYQVATRYANAVGGDGGDEDRTLSVSADGGAAKTLTLPKTASWDTWSTASVTLDLSAGTHTVTFARTAADSGNVNLDNVAVLTPGAPYPDPVTPPVEDCSFGTVCQAETAGLGGSAALKSDHNGYSGRGFVAGLESSGARDTLHVVDVPKAGDYVLQLRYSNGDASGAARDISVKAGAGVPVKASLPATSDWDAWRTVTVPVHLAAGADDVTVGCPEEDGCRVNLDTAAVTSRTSPLLSPHAPLGGYRRSLDGVNGEAPMTPGLLYQDGWTLLDDTASAIFDNATRKVTQRGDHAGKGYQDGYVFGYGHDYQQGLADLATLTGPSALLPRWAYGVWYSEYYDRSAADYENTILPKFRKDGVPLDVLVTDTDFKSPSTWDGWEMDPKKFPDPKAFFDWSAAQGLHNSLNIHPSISGDDPRFAQAQATAKGKLKDSGNNTYTFDWGDPDQLKAYFDLHEPMDKAGADVWWLDWCCDASVSSLGGVTPDAWINQQYADDSAKNGQRSFALSRAFGALPQGNYNPHGLPTGPWADKRTTAHFTGDSTSSWATLKFEVGYTPGESASTGLSNVSHDIGGFNNDGTQAKGAEPGTTKLPDDLYARWVQLGTFQPVDRLHGNHADRLPWQYGPASDASAEKFLNLREDLVPYTYSLSEQANRTGTPVVRPTYVQYPESQDAYATAGSEYFYGPDVLVAPVTTPGESATTSVWFPAGSSWTDYFTGKTYAGGTTQKITTGLDSMPVFIKSGGIMTTRTGNVANDVQNPLTKATVTVAQGAPGATSLYEDNGTTADSRQSATTAIRYAEHGANHTVSIAPASRSFEGQVSRRAWTVSFMNAHAPKQVFVNGRRVSAAHWSFDAGSRTLTVTAPAQSVHRPLEVRYH
ncbi:TIM-barrel domain-containing protein [Streptomyces misionensis]|uniref:TIM-barrel domain-containing protein n=1 Tax=Streptomyces misionensis TaxID=67331 RepID=UPI0033B27DB6